MLFKDITIIDEYMKAREHMYVGVQNGVISYLDDVPPEDEGAFGRIYSGYHKLLTPAFYNAHSHCAMNLMRGYGENLPLQEWLQTKTFPFEAHLTLDDVYLGTMAAVAEMLRFGIVATTDMYMHVESISRAFYESGIKANIGRGVTCADPELDYKDTPQYAATIKLKKQFAHTECGRLKVDFSIHAEYTNTDKMIKGVAAAAKENNGRIHVHVSETAGEVEGCKERHRGRTPVQYLEDCGVFDVPAVAAHCVHLTDRDISILKRNHVTVASCPKSNLKLASGFCPVARLRAAGVRIALGTDSVASNNNLNMLEEAKFYALIHKGNTGDPTLITPGQAFYSATRAGALAQGREDCGLIKKGYRADLIVFDTYKPYMYPVYNLLTNLIYSGCGTDIVLTMVDCKVLYEDGKFPEMDMKALVKKSNEACRRILLELIKEREGD